ncbi:transposase, partial [Escherichia coli]|uniref:transposase n=1 Tax=Escherichia coli TaxID=562 RepID=UPI000933E6FF
MIDVLGPEKRRRRTTQEKIAIVQQSFEPGMTVSLVARQHGVAASQLFLWCKQYQEGSLTAVAAGEQVVPASELAAAMKQIKELQRLLGKKTMENELLLLGNIILQVLESHGVPTVNKVQLGTTPVVRGAITSGELDIYPEYTGNGAFFFKDENDAAWKNA